MSNTKPVRHEILFNPVGALDHWPHLAAEFDARWVNDESKTVGERLVLADLLAIEIMTAAAVIPSKDRPREKGSQ